MSTELDRTGLDRIADPKIGRSRLGWRRPAEGEGAPRRFSRTKLLLLPMALVAAAGTWLVMSDSRGHVATNQPEPKTVGLASASLADNPLPSNVSFSPFTSEAIAPEPPSPLDKIKLLAQSWHRGGLGSNAQVTFILRNNNDFAVKDVEIACAFARRDGHYLTERSRLVPGTFEMRSRKSFERLHIGFVNVNASKAKCALVSASRT